MLLAPGAASVGLTAIGTRLSSDNGVAVSLLGMPLAFILCVVIAYRLARKTGDGGKVFGLTILFTLILAFVNFSIAIGGCIALPLKLDFR